MDYNEFAKVGTNLYKANGDYYRLFGTGITDNGCWIINPKMVELKDIDIVTGNDIYGTEIKINDITGTVSASREYRQYII
jgi:hypothetical protein